MGLKSLQSMIPDFPIREIVIKERARKDYGNTEMTDLILSMGEHGMLQPIILDQDFKLLAGGRRHRAAETLELERVPVVIFEVEGDVARWEIELAENMARKDLTWQEKVSLEKQIYDAKKADDPEWSVRKQADLTKSSKTMVARRREIANVMDMMPELADCATEDEAYKLYKRVINDAVSGQIVKQQRSEKRFQWADDHYRIGDAILGMSKLPDGAYQIAEVDPPYGINLKDIRRDSQDKYFLDQYSEISSVDYPQFVRAAAQQVFRVLGHNSYCIWWFGFDWYEVVRTALLDVGFKLQAIPGIWFKAQGQSNAPQVLLANYYESFFIARKGQPILQKPGRSNVFEFNGVPPTSRIHPTERPLPLIEEIIETFSDPASPILCPFLGSGNTIIAGYKRGQGCFGWDLNERSKDRFLSRVEEMFSDESGTVEEEANVSTEEEMDDD